MVRVRRVAWLAAGLAAVCGWLAAASAQETPPGDERLPLETIEPSEEPVVLTADEVFYDQTLDIVIARGNVEISQEQRLLRADRVTYNQRSQIVTATGNVVLIEPTGEVLFADYAELQDDLRDGFIRDVGILLTDDSRMAANVGVRRAGRITEIERGVYSPCNLCPEDPERAPLWQVRATRMVHDTESRDIVYRDAVLDMFGVPVLYTPYLSHPDPTVDRRTGFLTPLFGVSDDLGPFAFVPYYIDIAPEQDATITAGGTGDAGFFLRGEYRRRFRDGILYLDGSINRSDRLVDEGTANQREDERWRGHVFGNARFDLTEHWRMGGEIELTSDDTYLDIFNISDLDVLTNRGYIEGFYGLNYVSAEVFGFQDLRAGALDQSKVLPVVNVNWMTEPGELLGGQGFIDGNIINLVENPEQTRRISAEGGWRRDYYTDIGLVTNVLASIRGDAFFVQDFTGSPGSTTVVEPDVTAGRFYPLGEITARYPLVRQSENWQQLIEPVLSFSASTAIGNQDDIPNNDSQTVEFDEINLLSPNRFPGIDEVEEGVRVTYGLNTGLYHVGGGFVSLFLGQSYRLDGDPDFPDGSGLDSRVSDVVGRLRVAPASWLNVDYRFRFDQETLAARRQELTAAAGVPLFRATATYTFLDTEEGAFVDVPREEIVFGASSQFTEYWLATTSFRRDLEENENRSIGAGLYYGDECFQFGVTWLRDLTEDRDREGGDSFLITIAFRNLGDPINIGTSSLF